MVKTVSINYTTLDLTHATIDEHCLFLRRVKNMPFWWYMDTQPIIGNYSLPFVDRQGHWWFQVKPGLCWPVDILLPIEIQKSDLKITQRYLGCQYVCDRTAICNSSFMINVISELGNYDTESIDSKRRNAIRKGAGHCELSIIKAVNKEVAQECTDIWNDLTRRARWKHERTKKYVEESWGRLLDVPGVSIMIAVEAATGRIAGFLITKVIGDTAFVDTIASSTDLLRTNPNDILLYTFIMNAKSLSGIKYVHYAMVSYDEKLEFFKKSMGFQPVRFKTVTVLNPLVEFVLKKCYPKHYDRMIGRI